MNLAVRVVGGSKPYRYAWKHGERVEPVATSETYAIRALKEADAGSYVVEVTDSLGAIVSSAPFELKIDEAAVDPIPFEPTQEIRYAVVMYGGVSLAIYINGVVQELLHLVRATAPGADGSTLYSGSELKSTEGVYRRLGQILAWGEEADHATAADAPVSTRFVVDVISGTSAGGINGVFLAKALANEQPIDELKKLWVKEGDITLLVNDAKSYADLKGLSKQAPPQSVLNSRRMYWKLLEALHGMDEHTPDARKERGASALVEELDLWVTATDLRGLMLPIDLYDRVVFEKRHKNVFHFVYGSERARGEARNDFLRATNPFLAFAARATSSFPFAFEPMSLDDIDQVLANKRFNEYGAGNAQSGKWNRFFSDYINARRSGPAAAEATPPQVQSEDPALSKYYRSEAFGDGGYLDNKPFSWATGTLAHRRADIPVQRRLLYVEPDPGGPLPLAHDRAKQVPPPPNWTQPTVKPDPIENVTDALLTLPRTETIRDDLAALIERNRQLSRIADIARIADRLDAQRPVAEQLPEVDVWRGLPVSDVLERRGLQYTAYHRLKVSADLDELSEWVARAAGLNPESDDRSAVRCVLQAWFDRRYPESGTGDQSQNEFLLRFDVGYRFRRLDFLNRRIDELLRLDQNALGLFARFNESGSGIVADDPEQAKQILRRAKKLLNDARMVLRADVRWISAQSGVPADSEIDPGAEIRRAISATGLTRESLLALLNGASTRDESVERARTLLGDNFGPIEEAADAVSDALKPAFTRARSHALQATRMDRPDFARPDAVGTYELNQVVLAPLRSFYDQYEEYDSVIFPIAYGITTEAARAEVIRISPLDATSLINETSPSESRRKLAGVALGHFGGFFERAWRQNDIMWGRLDAAERLMTTLLPDSDERKQLLKDAQMAIVRDEFGLNDLEPLTALVVDSILAADSSLIGVPAALAGADPKSVAAAVASSVTPERMLEYLRDSYEVNREIDRRGLMATTGRATRVTGLLLDGISADDRYKVLKKPSRWLIRVGRTLWTLVEMTTPRTFAEILTRYWLPLVLFMSGLLIIGGAVFGAPATAKAGWVLLGLTALWKLALWFIDDIIRKRSRLFFMLAALALALVLGLAVTEVARHLSHDVAQLIAHWHWLDTAVRWIWPWKLPPA
ncbi:MAG: patatin-like protein [Actinomycetota bacterium]